MRQRLDNKVVMITGAARGIGAETARRAAAKGARVSLVGLEPERLKALADELGERAAWFEADVTERRGYVMIVSSTAAFTMMPGLAAYAASKAAVEQFANCLRLEIAHKGVSVGSVHPGWIDTDLVRDQRKDLKTFDEAFDKFPWPMNATTSVEDCADAIVDGMERRRRRVYVPKAIALVQALRTLTTGAVGNWIIRREAAPLVPQMEAEIAKLGRYFGSSSVALPPTPASGEQPKQPA